MNKTLDTIDWIFISLILIYLLTFISLILFMVFKPGNKETINKKEKVVTKETKAINVKKKSIKKKKNIADIINVYLVKFKLKKPAKKKAVSVKKGIQKSSVTKKKNTNAKPETTNSSNKNKNTSNNKKKSTKKKRKKTKKTNYKKKK